MTDIYFPYEGHDKKLKLSAVFMADNFVYGLFDSNDVLVGAYDLHPYQEFDAVIKKWQPDVIKVGVKSIFFGHFGDLSRVPPSPLESAKSIDKMTGQSIWCVYESPFTPKDLPVRHFSTLINHHYFLRHPKAFHIHFDEDHMHFYLQKHGEMLLYNMYRLDAVGDLMFYFSLLSQSFDVDPQKIPIYLSGMLDTESKLYNKLSSLHTNFEFAEYVVNADQSLPKSIKAHHHFEHFINISCV